MPFISDADVQATDLPVQRPDQPSAFLDFSTKPPIGKDEVLAASFRRHNEFGSAIAAKENASLINGLNRLDPDFNPHDVLKARGIADEIFRTPELAFTNSEEEIDSLLEFRERQRRDQEILANSGIYGFLSAMAAGLASPTTLVPAGAAIKGISRSAAAISNFSKSAVLIGGSVAAQEAFLQQTQTERTLHESSVNTIAAAFLAGTLGAGIGALSSGARNVLKEHVKNAVTQGFDIQLTKEGGFKAVRGASAEVSTITDEGLAKVNISLAKLTQPGVFKSTNLEGLTSRFGIVRRMTSDIFDSGLITKRNVEGIATRAAEKRADVIRGRTIADSYRTFRAQYNQYMGGKSDGAVATFINKAKAGRQGKMTPNEFSDQVVTAIWNGNQHAIAEVEAVAKQFSKVMDDLTEQMKEVGIFGQELKLLGDKSYFSRIYNAVQIRRNPEKFKLLLLEKQFRPARAAARKERARLIKENKLDKPDAKPSPEVKKRLAELKKVIAQTDDNLEALVEKITDNILNEGEISSSLDDVITSISKGQPSFLKERVIDIPSNDMSEFLVKDALGILDRYVTQATRLIEYKRWLNDNNFSSIGDVKGSIRAESQTMQNLVRGNEKLSAKAIEKEITKIVRDATNAEKFVEDAFNMMMGRFFRNTKLNKALGYLRKSTIMGKLGALLISQFPDASFGIIRHGLPDTLRSMEKMAEEVAASLKGELESGSILIEDLRFASVALELELNSVMRAMTDPGEDAFIRSASSNPFGKTGEVIDRGFEIATGLFGRLTGAQYWNQGAKIFTGHTSMMKTIKSLLKWEREGIMPQKDIERLASIGIGKDIYSDVLNAYKRHGAQHKGGYVFGLRDLADENKELADTIATAIRRDVDSVILTPRTGDLPRFVATSQTGVARTFMLFQSFAMTASSRLLLSSLQKRDAAVVMGIIGAMGMAALSGVVKSVIAGREPDLSPDALLKDGITRSGILGWFIGDQVVSFAMSRLGGTGATRFAGINFHNKMLGPVIGGTLKDTAELITEVTDGDLGGDDAAALAKLMPFQNLFYLRMLLRELNE